MKHLRMRTPNLFDRSLSAILICCCLLAQIAPSLAHAEPKPKTKTEQAEAERRLAEENRIKQEALLIEIQRQALAAEQQRHEDSVALRASIDKQNKLAEQRARDAKTLLSASTTQLIFVGGTLLSVGVTAATLIKKAQAVVKVAETAVVTSEAAGTAATAVKAAIDLGSRVGGLLIIIDKKMLERFTGAGPDASMVFPRQSKPALSEHPDSPSERQPSADLAKA